MERSTIMGIWYQLSANARRDLVTNLSEMLGETPALIQQAEATADAAGEGPTGRPPRVRPWARPLLKEISEFQAFGKKTSKERKGDKHTPMLISIAMGVIKRGKDAGMTDEEILAAIRANLEDIDSLKGLYPKEDDDDDDDANQGGGGDPPPPAGGASGVSGQKSTPMET